MTKQVSNVDANVNKLSQALIDMQNWRGNKTNKAESIPDKLWQQIFALEGLHTPSQLSAIFKLSHRQYTSNKKRVFETTPSQTKINSEAPVSEFCEANLIDNDKSAPADDFNSESDSDSESPPQVALSSPSPYALESLPNAKTLIVEFCRKDGAIMKIHTTQDSIDIVMDNFFNGAA